MAAERDRLDEARDGGVLWKRWGPYLSERQWGTVREDYSEGGDAWNSFSHDQARSRAYRWGEDGLAGVSDEEQRICLALALWNGRDPILKERLFGLTNGESNHGEDVKEYYFYLDSTPTHSYMKYLYKYPQAAYPYDDLVRTSGRRSRQEPEYELLDTGVFDQDRYFDVFVEYAKATPEDLLVQVAAWNRGPEPATLHVLPTVWFRNVWSWGGKALRPSLQKAGGRGGRVIALSHPDVGERFFHFEGGATPLFTENETNAERLFGTPNPTPYVKDAFHDYLVHGRKHAVNPDEKGTKAAVHHSLTIPAGQSRTLRFRLREPAPGKDVAPFEDFDAVLQARRGEADEFYASVIPPSLSADARNDTRKFQEDPHWRDLVLFYEYFHGDNGSGIGASHQTGWTGLVARGMHLFATTTPAQVLALGKAAGVTEVTTRPGGRGAGRPRQ